MALEFTGWLGWLGLTLCASLAHAGKLRLGQCKTLRGQDSIRAWPALRFDSRRLRIEASQGKDALHHVPTWRSLVQMRVK